MLCLVCVLFAELDFGKTKPNRIFFGFYNVQNICFQQRTTNTLNNRRAAERLEPKWQHRQALLLYIKI